MSYFGHSLSHVLFVTLSATDDGSGNKATNDNGTGKANDNGTGSKAINDSGAERYQAYLKCTHQVKASDSGTG